MTDDEIDPPDDEFDGAGQDADQETVDAANPARLRDRRKREVIEKENSDNFWRRVLSDPVGRKEVWKLLQAGHAFEERFACGPNGFPQTEATWFQAGEQAFVLRIYQSLLVLDRDAIALMHDEYDHRFGRRKPKRAGT
jgi:hypothetical protein